MQLRDAIAATILDPESLCAGAQRRTLRNIAKTLDQVSITTFANLGNLNVATRGTLMDLIEVTLMARRWSRIGLPRRQHRSSASFSR